jgi:predicted O-methyltransferase YrrM
VSDYDEDAVLAQVAKRKRIAEARVAEWGLLEPGAVAASGDALLRGRVARQRAKAAERAGQLDLGGGGS